MSSKVLLSKPSHLVLIVTLVLCLIQLVLSAVAVGSTQKIPESTDQKNAYRSSVGNLVVTLLTAPMLGYVLYQCVKLPSAPKMFSPRF